jgi:hypothetical protein
LKQDGKLDEPQTGVNVDTPAEAYLRYMTNSKAKSYLWVKRAWDKHLEPFFGGRLAGHFVTSELDRYIEQRKQGIDDQDQERKRNATINRELTVMKAMSNHASRELDQPLVPRVAKFPKIRTQTIRFSLGETAVQCGTFESLGAGCARGAKVPIL